MELIVLFNFMRLLICIIINFSFLIVCSRERYRNNEFMSWRGRRISDNKKIVFSDHNGKGVIINVYSPACRPCIEELPALHLLYQIAAVKDIAMYLAVEGKAEAHGIKVKPGISTEQTYEFIKKRLIRDKNRFKIKIPFVIMDYPFAVDPGKSSIKATPVTLLFRTKPFLLTYYYSGQITDEKNKVKILENKSFRQFIKRFPE